MHGRCQRLGWALGLFLGCSSEPVPESVPTTPKERVSVRVPRVDRALTPVPPDATWVRVRASTDGATELRRVTEATGPVAIAVDIDVEISTLARLLEGLAAAGRARAGFVVETVDGSLGFIRFALERTPPDSFVVVQISERGYRVQGPSRHGVTVEALEDHDGLQAAVERIAEPQADPVTLWVDVQGEPATPLVFGAFARLASRPGPAFAVRFQPAPRDEGRGSDSPNPWASPAPGEHGPTVALGEVVTSGSVDGALVRRILRLHLGTVRGCYVTALARDDTLAGTVRMEFDIDARGRVHRVQARGSSVDDAGLERCMKSAARRWTFVRPRDGTAHVASPFVLSPSCHGATRATG